MHRRRVPYYLAAVIALMTFVIYIPALWNDFVNWDDDHYVTENYRIRTLDAAFAGWAFTHTALNYWHPVTLLSFAADYALWGLKPAGYHLINILLHAANTWIVVCLMIWLLTASREASRAERLSSFLDDRAIMTAGVATGLLFGLHPLHVESVAWISQRKDLLCAFFSLLSVGAYIKYAGSTRDVRAGAKTFFRNRHYLLSMVFFILALASKPMAVSLPLVLLILDWHPFRRISSVKQAAAAAGEKIPFIIPVVVVSLVTFAAQAKIGAMMSLQAVPLSSRLLVAAGIPVTYLWKMALPLHLSPIYPYPETSLAYLPAAVGVCVITASCILWAKKRRTLVAAWGYYLITLLPVVGIVRVGYTPVADRFTYLPSLGPFALLGLAAAWIWAKADSLKAKGRLLKIAAVFAALLLLILMTVLTIRQIGVWKNSLVLWNYILEKEPSRIPIVYTNRGAAYADTGDLGRAMEDFNRAIDLDPTEYTAYNNRGVLFKMMGQLDQAMADYTKAVALNPTFANAYANRGWIHREQGRLDPAIEDYTKAIALKPSHVSYMNRGRAFYEKGQVQQALEDFSAAIRLNPSYADAYTSRGLVLHETGQSEQALEDFNRAIALNPSSVDAYINRGVTLERMGDFDRAMKDYEKAIALNPSDSLAFANRGVIFAKKGSAAEALDDYTKAISLNPDMIKTYLDRGDLYLKMGKKDLAAKDYRKACSLGSEAGCAATRAAGKMTAP